MREGGEGGVSFVELTRGRPSHRRAKSERTSENDDTEDGEDDAAAGYETPARRRRGNGKEGMEGQLSLVDAPSCRTPSRGLTERSGDDRFQLRSHACLVCGREGRDRRGES